MFQLKNCISFVFLFYLQGSSKLDIHCDSMSTTKGSVPNHPFPYSDHEALTSELRLDPHTPAETGSDGQSKDQECAAGIFLWHLYNLRLV